MSPLELRQLDQVAGRIVEHDPARSAIFLDAPRQIDLMGAQAFDGCVEIIHRKGDDRKASRNRIERRKRSAFEDDEIDAAQIKMRALLIVHQQAQADHVAIEVCGRRNIFGP